MRGVNLEGQHVPASEWPQSKNGAVLWWKPASKKSSPMTSRVLRIGFSYSVVGGEEIYPFLQYPADTFRH